jgi:hypothetical protein
LSPCPAITKIYFRYRPSSCVLPGVYRLMTITVQHRLVGGSRPDRISPFSSRSTLNIRERRHCPALVSADHRGCTQPDSAAHRRYSCWSRLRCPFTVTYPLTACPIGAGCRAYRSWLSRCMSVMQLCSPQCAACHAYQPSWSLASHKRAVRAMIAVTAVGPRAMTNSPGDRSVSEAMAAERLYFCIAPASSSAPFLVA